MCKASDLLAAYEMVKVSATKGGLNVFTLAGDGDSCLTAIQHSGMFNTIRTEHSLLNTLEYPPMLAFSSSRFEWRLPNPGYMPLPEETC